MKIFQILLIVITFIFGGLTGFFLKHLPFVRWNPEVKIYEIFQVCITLFIGIAIPFFIKKWIEDKRHIKNTLIEECKECLQHIKKVKEKIEICYTKKSVNGDDKDSIILLFSDAESKIQNLNENLLLAFSNNKSSEKTANNIKNSYLKYWTMVTGGSLMNSGYLVIDESFYRNQLTEFSDFEKNIRQAIIFIHTI